LVSSLVIRSTDTISSRPAWSVMAARTSSATVNPSLAANLAARRMRSGSSPNDRSGGPGVRSNPFPERLKSAERVGELVVGQPWLPSR